MTAPTLHQTGCNIEAPNLAPQPCNLPCTFLVQHRTTYVRNGQQNPSCTACKTEVSPYRNLTANHLDQTSHRGNQLTARAEIGVGRDER